MAAQSKTTAVHFSLIIFVMLSVILAVVALLFYNDYRNQQAEYKQNQTELTEAQGSVRRMGNDLTALKEIIGISGDQVGAGGGGEGTVIGQSQQLIQTLGTNPAEATFVGTLKDLREDYNDQVKQLSQSKVTIAKLQSDLQSLNEKYQSIVAEHTNKRQAAEQNLTAYQTQFDEKMAAKDKTITEMRTEVAAVQSELQQVKGQTDAKIAELERKKRVISTTLQLTNAKLDKMEGMSFEVPDGKIVTVDQVGGTVWINLGENAGLNPRVTFSVYAKTNSGVGRVGPQGGSPEDIKGKIQVTRILGKKLAEARIISAEGDLPISPGDPIYTPVWSAGRIEQFAFAGGIDIDGDGDYEGDRQRLHKIIEGAGAKISTELLMTGERRGGPIDQNTRFLVRGELPEVSEAAPNTPEFAQYEKLGNEWTKLQEEALNNGVRTIGLNSFLDMIGFVPQQNRFIPGESKEWTLKTGAPAPPTQFSNGNYSGIFETDRSKPVPSSRTATERFE